MRVKVQLKQADDVLSPELSDDEANEDLGKIRAVLTSPDPMKSMMGVPDVAWLATQGQNIVAASLVERPKASAMRLA